MKKLLIWGMALLFSMYFSLALADEKPSIKKPAGAAADIEPVKPKKTLEHEIKEEIAEKKEKKKAKKAKKETKKESSDKKEDKKEDKKDK